MDEAVVARSAEEAEMSFYKILTSAAVLWIALPAPAGAAIKQARVSGGTVMGTINNGVASFKGNPFATSSKCGSHRDL
jgi:hypothetical protein